LKPLLARTDFDTTPYLLLILPTIFFLFNNRQQTWDDGQRAYRSGEVFGLNMYLLSLFSYLMVLPFAFKVYLLHRRDCPSLKFFAKKDIIKSLEVYRKNQIIVFLWGGYIF
jgi:hypothetical protein